MAEVIGGLSTSHVPMIGKAIAAKRQEQVSFRPFFDGYAPVRQWVAQARPDIAVVIYNDHGLNFFLDTMPTFALGVAREYANADEGWGPPVPHVFPGAPRLGWHIADRLVADEFDIATCQEMLFDHAGATALDLVWPDGVPVATIPVVINAVQPPLPTPRRCYKIGQAIGRAIRAYPEPLKVLVIGSGGLSHSLGQSGSINQAYDKRCMDQMLSDPEALASLTNDEIVRDAGTQGLEILTWIAMRGVVAGPVDLVASTYHAPISHTGGAMMLFDARGSRTVA